MSEKPTFPSKDEHREATHDEQRGSVQPKPPGRKAAFGPAREARKTLKEAGIIDPSSDRTPPPPPPNNPRLRDTSAETGAAADDKELRGLPLDMGNRDSLPPGPTSSILHPDIMKDDSEQTEQGRLFTPPEPYHPEPYHDHRTK